MRDKRPTSFEGEHEGFDLHAAFKEAAHMDVVFSFVNIPRNLKGYNGY